jgi:uncharacterized protein
MIYLLRSAWGLATRGNTCPSAEDVAHAVKLGVNYLNWCGYEDGLAQALRGGLVERRRVVLSTQLQARDAHSAARELGESRRVQGAARIDVVTFYYVEQEQEWHEIVAPEGALEALNQARHQGHVRLIGLPRPSPCL